MAGNSKDYGISAMEKLAEVYDSGKVLNIASYAHMYVFEWKDKSVRATRIEIPASITATEFYRKCGYDYKNGVKELDEEHHYRLEKFKEAGK